MTSSKPDGLRFTMNCADGTVLVEGETFSLPGADVPEVLVAAALAHARYWETVDDESQLPLGDEVHIDLVRLNGKYAVEFSGEEGYFPSAGMALAAFVEFCSAIEDLLLDAGDAEGEVLGPLDTPRGWQAPREDIEA